MQLHMQTYVLQLHPKLHRSFTSSFFSAALTNSTTVRITAGFHGPAALADVASSRRSLAAVRISPSSPKDPRLMVRYCRNYTVLILDRRKSKGRAYTRPCDTQASPSTALTKYYHASQVDTTAAAKSRRASTSRFERVEGGNVRAVRLHRTRDISSSASTSFFPALSTSQLETSGKSHSFYVLVCISCFPCLRPTRASQRLPEKSFQMSLKVRETEHLIRSIDM